MLGFDAIGRLALGQLSAAGTSNRVMVAEVGLYPVAGLASAFRISQGSAGDAFAALGDAIMFRASLSGATSNFSLVLNDSESRISHSASPGSHVVSGEAANFANRFSTTAGAYSVSGKMAPLGPSLVSGVGWYSVTGYDAGYVRDFEAWFPRPFDTDGWMAGAIEGDSWATLAPPAETWTAQAESSAGWSPSINQPESWSAE